uniref:Keratin 99 n=1 Tax=Oryzias latipes TaxID=8090 RepID=A0A3P9H1W6_ORYLA
MLPSLKEYLVQRAAWTKASSMFHASPLRGWMRAPSVHGGAGGCGTRVSLSTCAGSWGSGHADTPAHCTEKLTMQNLNMRLSNYLEKVRSLEEENRKLELNIRELCLKKTVTPHNFSRYFETINDLRVEVKSGGRALNQSLTLQMDNHRLAAEDFRMKYETELSLRKAVDADIFRLRKVRDGLTLGISDLEIIVENLQEELVTLKKNHSEVRVGQTSTVNVEVDAANSVDLTEVLEKVRVSYEAVLKKNKLELEAWYHCKMESLQKEIVSCTTEVKTFETELTELKRTYQSLEIKRESVQLLRENLEEANSFCSITLSQQQETIYSLEMQLQELKVSLQQMQVKYSMLLQLRMKLEAEIAEYRRLLEGEHQEKKRWDNKLTSPKHHIEKRVRTIVEEIIDGQVVSSSQKTQVQTIQ